MVSVGHELFPVGIFSHVISHLATEGASPMKYLKWQGRSDIVCTSRTTFSGIDMIKFYCAMTVVQHVVCTGVLLTATNMMWVLRMGNSEPRTGFEPTHLAIQRLLVVVFVLLMLAVLRLVVLLFRVLAVLLMLVLVVLA